DVLRLDEDLNGRKYTTIKFPIIQGDKTLLAGYTIDITERKQAEDALKKSETLLLELTTQVPGVVYQFYARPNGEIGFYYVSDRSERILGIKSDLDGYFERFITLVIPEHREGCIKSIEKSVKESSDWNYEGMLQKPSGEKIWFSGNSTPSPRENEIVFNGIVTDITERKQVEEALAESNMIFNQFMINSPSLIYIKDEKLRLQKISKNMEALLGKPTIELLGKDSYDLLPPEFAKSAIADDLKVLNDDKPVEVEEELNGRVYSTLKFPIHRGEGQPAYLAGFSIDITERKQVEDALRNSEEKHRAVVEMANDGIIILQDGIIRFSNPSLAAILGYETGEVEGMNLSSFIPQENMKLILERYRKRMAGEKLSAVFETVLLHKSGKKISAEVSGSVIQYKRKSADLVVIHDITERKKAEEALKLSEERHRVLFESSHDAIMTIEPPSWKFTNGNPATLELFKVKNETEFISYGPWDVSPDLQPDGRASAEKSKEMIESAMRNGSCFFEWTHKRITGEDFFATVLLSRIKQGEKTFLQATVRDITKQKQLELQLKDKIADLEQYKKVTVGREHKMIELKKEINELCKQTNQKPRYEEL
ncbi:MAG: PAS domain S-box protein, partial [Euryarchaeota archaeon]|nr:PAS domain S-box protein [Euryarchaeota archaeon]